MIELNPHSGFYFGRVASLMMLRATNRKFARRLLLDLLSRTSHAVVHVARVLSPDLWWEEWQRASDSVLRLVYGQKEDELGYRLMTIKLVGNLLGGDATAQAPLPAQWQALATNTLLSVSDPHGLVANHAAYAAMHFAELVEQSDLIDMVVRSIHAASDDPRTIVRMAAGYEAARMRVRARSTLIRDAAEAIAQKLEQDPYVSVQRELRFGGIEARSMENSNES